MIHAKDVLDRLGALSPIEFGDDVFRATRHGLDRAFGALGVRELNVVSDESRF